MDTILQYVAVISAAGAGISFVVGLWKYLDQRAREERTKRFELYHNLMRGISAFGESEKDALPLTEQVAAIYELQHFPEYSFSSVPILRHLREFYGTKGRQPPVLMQALDATLQKLGAL